MIIKVLEKYMLSLNILHKQESRINFKIVIGMNEWLTLHVDSDPGGDGEGEVVVAGLTRQLSAKLGAGEVLDAETVLDGAAVAALIARVDQVAVAPPRYLRQGVT